MGVNMDLNIHKKTEVTELNVKNLLDDLNKKRMSGFISNAQGSIYYTKTGSIYFFYAGDLNLKACLSTRGAYDYVCGLFDMFEYLVIK